MIMMYRPTGVLCRRAVQLLSSRSITTFSTSSPPCQEDIHRLDQWIKTEKKLEISDILRPEHLSDLYTTLPTRDGSLRPTLPPKVGAPLGFGHHLVFFHPRNPENALRADGTDADFCPPEPWTRRMWAGGRFEWLSPLLVGDSVTAVSTIASVEKKGFEKGSPMVFVRQAIEYVRESSGEVCAKEERSHVYLAEPGNKRGSREVQDLPSPDFTFQYLPSPTTLFRFSALTFNGHYIHLDKEYAKAEGYPERLVHGPLTALMLLESTVFNYPDAQPESFEYRAINPLVVGRAVKLHGARNQNSVFVWAEDEHNVVGMTGTIKL